MSPFQSVPNDYYQLLGVASDAEVREIEAAYWQFARTLRGQAGMAPYNKAYEVLANSERRRAYDADRVAPPPPASEEAPSAAPPLKDVARTEPPPTKFGWPAA
jgi:curved DNA-binding protein CbpA